jgi:dTDP-4-dehydrorhamnose reductase
LIIGASGFLGSRMLSLAPSDSDVTGTGSRRPVPEGGWRTATLDASSPSAVRSLIERLRPEAIFYLSYHTADRSITVEGARVAAQSASRLGARFFLTSTDLVFDGEHAPYRETDVAMPVSPYGGLKLEAEMAVRDACAHAVVLRPALMAGESRTFRRPSFEIEHFEAGTPVPLYADEWRSVVSVDDVARALWELAPSEVTGTFHLGGPQKYSRAEFGRALCARYGYDAGLIQEAKRPADRPMDTSLDSTRLTRYLGWTPGDALAVTGLQLPASSYQFA